MFRIIVAALAIIGLASLFTDVGAGLAIGALALAPLFFLMKLAFFAFLFTWFVRAGRRHGRPAGWSKGWRSRDLPTFMERWGEQPSRRPAAQPGRDDRDRFERWHDLAHAREEVDSWVDDQDTE